MSSNESADVVSISDITRRLWRGRGYLLALPALGLIIGLSIVAFSVFRTAHQVVYYIALNNIEDSRYPNGTRFQAGDLTSPPVLNALREKLDLPANTNLAAYIDASLDSPQADAVANGYRSRLASRNLTQADITAINAAFTDQMNATISKNVRIAVNYTGAGLSEAMGRQIALTLPKIWTDVYTKQFRTLLPLQLSAALPANDLADFQSPVGVLAINARLNDIKRGLDVIMNDNRLSAIQDQQGETADDILSRLKLYSDVYFRPVFAFYVGNDSVVSNFFLKDQLLQIEELDQRVAAIDATASKLQAFQNGSIGVASADSSNPGESRQTGFQLDSGAMGQIIDLAGKASNAEYLKQLLDRRQIATDEIANIRRQIGLARSPEVSLNAGDLSQQAFNRYSELAKHYNDILKVARTVAQDRSGTLFQPVTSPEVRKGIISTASIALTAGLTFLGLALAGIYALFLLPAKRRVHI